MRQQWQAIIAELEKNRHVKITWISFLAFSLAPVFGAIFMLLMKDSGYDGLSGAFKAKAVLMSFEASWNSYLGMLSQAMAIGGIIISGFIVSWVFGREYSDGTAKDLLSLPVSRTSIIHAKFFYSLIWCLCLALSNLFLGLLFGYLIRIPGWSQEILSSNLKTYFITTILIIPLVSPVAFFALYGKGYLAPLGMVILAVLIAQIMGAMGYGNYFPWAVPAIFSGSAGADLILQLNLLSYLILALTSVAGYLGTIIWWKYADQT